MTKPKTYRTTTGRVLSTGDVDAIAEDVEPKDYDVDALEARRRGRPLMRA